MRIATFNVENLFRRPRAMNLEEWADGKKILEEFSKFNARIQKDVYTAADKTAILNSAEALGILKKDDNKFVILRQNHGRLLKRPANKPVEVVASGRGDWIGWLELHRETVNEIATQMTARVIEEVAADVLAVVEAEDRIALARFDEQLLQQAGSGYGSAMLIDGNDDRGIDVGVFYRPPCSIESMVSHVDDELSTGQKFCRDCPEFTIRSGSARLLLMVCHFKSKGHGPQNKSNERREAEATRVREIYDERRAQGVKHIAIVGDFNDTPDSAPLARLLGEGSDLQDIFEHPLFVGDGRPGTFANGTKSNKIDYILLSPELFAKVTAGGVFRKGVWGGVNGTLFPHFEEMTEAIHAASDHAAVWADVEI
jgi:endonuclease/exonuclease/phosphatase family metal-dependent hydrolase